MDFLNHIVRIQDIGGNYHYRCETMQKEILLTRAAPHKYLELTTNKTTGDKGGEVKNFKSEKALRSYLTEQIYLDSER